MKRNDLTGKKFGEWTAIQYLGNKKYLCKCSCGQEKEIGTYKLTSGQSKSCGHNSNKFIDLTGQIFGEWTVIDYAGDHKWNCKCSCGKIKEVSSIYLREGKSRSCGHATTGFKDIKGHIFGEWTAIKPKGKTLWECQCSCGKVQDVKLYDLISGRSKSCGHNTTGFIDLTGKVFGHLTVKKYLSNKNWECICDCGNTTIVNSQYLRNGTSTHCGCKTSENRKTTMIIRYGVGHLSQMHRSAESIEITSSKENFEAFLKKLGRKITPADLSKLINLQPSRTMVLIRQFELDDYIDLHKATSEYENEIDRLFPGSERNNRDTLSGKEIDLYYRDQKIGIEFNGDYWHSEIYKNSMYHQEKSLTALKKEVRLIHIFEHEWLDDRTRQILIRYINNILGYSKIKRIPARKCVVRDISLNESSEFLDKYHLQGSAISSVQLGIYNNEILIGVMTFGKPRFNTAYEYELVRLCYADNIQITGGSQKLFKHFLREYSPKSVISYCDIAKFSGESYKRLGFSLEEVTKPNYIWFSPADNRILSRYQTQKHILVENGLGTSEQTEAEIMHNLGYIKIYDCGNFKFIWEV